jgi:hypothetical protein
VTELVIGDLRTGRQIINIPSAGVHKASWSTSLNDADTIEATFKLTDPDTKQLELRSAAAPAKAFLAIVENDVPVAGGPIWIHTRDKNEGTLQVSAKGMWSYFDHRVLVPLVAATLPIVDSVTREPSAVMNTNLVAQSYGMMAKRLVMQARAHTGGAVPIVFQDDEAGTYTRQYLGSDLSIVGEKLKDFTQLENGIDIAFTPRWTGDRQGIEWVLRTGTLAKPMLSSETIHLFDYSVEDPAVKDLTITVNASNLTSRTWAVGGRQDDVAVIERADDTALLGAGYPLLESVNTAHSDATVPSTVRSYAAEDVRWGRTPVESWSFKASADADPKVGSYAVGDWCDVQMADDDYVPDGTYRHRIAGLSGDQDGRWVSVTTLEVNSA